MSFASSVCVAAEIKRTQLTFSSEALKACHKDGSEELFSVLSISVPLAVSNLRSNSNVFLYSYYEFLLIYLIQSPSPLRAGAEKQEA